MENNYWKNDNLIIASNAEKLEILKYEALMFSETCKLIENKSYNSQFDLNLLLESLAVHARTLIEFFYNDEKRNPNDLIAQDLLPSNIIWREIRPVKTDILEDTKNKADKQLAHMSLWRIKLVRDGKKGWKDWETIKRDIENVSSKFWEIYI